MTTLARKLSPKQRQFWWRVAHKNYMTNNRAHKCKIDAQGRASNECPICRHEIETWNHMEFECDGVKNWMERMKTDYGNRTGRDDWKTMTREEWRLETDTTINDDKMMWIALGRWVYHKHRCNVIHKQRRRIDIDIIADELEEN